MKGTCSTFPKTSRKTAGPASVPAALTILALVAASASLLLTGCVRRYEPGRPTSRAAGGGPSEKTASPASPRLPDELAARGLSGPVRTVTSRSYRPSFDGSGKPEMYLTSVLSFDRAGRFLSEVQTDPAGKEVARYVPRRDSAGRIVELESRSPSGLPDGSMKLEYDDSGRMVRESYFGSDGRPSGGYLYEYGPGDRPARKSMRTEYEDGSVRTNRTDYRYDEAGLLIEETISDESLGGVVLRIEHAYQNGRRVRSSDFQRGRWLEFLTFYEHDSRGNVVREASYQIPESEYGDSFSSVTAENGIPKSFLASFVETEYEYH